MVPVGLAAAWAAKKATGLFAGIVKFFASLTAKQWMIIGAFCLFAFAQYKFYDYSVNHGKALQAAVDKPVIEKLTSERNEADRKYKAYRQGFINWIKATQAAQKQYEADQKVIVDDLEWRLKNAETKKTTKQKELSREIPKYIPTASLRNYDLPLGFIRLYDISLEGQNPEGATNGFLSGSLPIDVEAASGVKLSDAADPIIQNNLECVYRGEVIKAWQEWYPRMKAAYDKAVKTQADTVPEPMPAPPSALMLDTDGGAQVPPTELPTALPLIASVDPIHVDTTQ